jgi:hypothetical protein
MVASVAVASGPSNRSLLGCWRGRIPVVSLSFTFWVLWGSVRSAKPSDESVDCRDNQREANTNQEQQTEADQNSALPPGHVPGTDGESVGTFDPPFGGVRAVVQLPAPSWPAALSGQGASSGAAPPPPVL